MASAKPHDAIVAPPTADGRRAAPLRILHLGPDRHGGGGMATVIRGLLMSSLGERHHLYAATSYRSADPVQRLVVFGRSLVILALWCRGPGSRIVHVHMTVRGSMYRKAVLVASAKALRRPVVLHVHAGATEIEIFHSRLGRVRRLLLSYSIGLADRVLSVSSAGARALGECFGRSDATVVPNAAPPVAPPPLRARAHRGDAVTVLYLGGFANPVKGGEVLIEALASVIPALPAIRVLLAGPGELPSAARALVAGAAPVRWLGWLEENAKATALADSDVFVLPSISEGLPMALLEAMASGLAVIATDMGGVPDVLSDGVDGVVVPPGDPGSLASALRSLIERPDRRVALAAAARSRAAELGEVQVAARLDAIYRELAPS